MTRKRFYLLFIHLHLVRNTITRPSVDAPALAYAPHQRKVHGDKRHAPNQNYWDLIDMTYILNMVINRGIYALLLCRDTKMFSISFANKVLAILGRNVDVKKLGEPPS